MVIQPLDAEQVDDAAMHAGLGVAGAVDDATDARVHDGASAHRAGFKRDIEFTAGQPVVAERARRIAQRGDFGMCRRIVLADRRIETAADNLAIEHDDRPDRNFAQTLRRPRQGHRLAHEVFVTQAGGKDIHSIFRSHYSSGAGRVEA